MFQNHKQEFGLLFSNRWFQWRSRFRRGFGLFIGQGKVTKAAWNYIYGRRAYLLGLLLFQSSFGNNWNCSFFLELGLSGKQARHAYRHSLGEVQHPLSRPGVVCEKKTRGQFISPKRSGEWDSRILLYRMHLNNAIYQSSFHPNRPRSN